MLLHFDYPNVESRRAYCSWKTSRYSVPGKVICSADADSVELSSSMRREFCKHRYSVYNISVGLHQCFQALPVFCTDEEDCSEPDCLTVALDNLESGTTSKGEVR